MPGRLRIAARSDLLSDMRRKMASSVSFLPTTTSTMDATLACCGAMLGLPAGGALAAGAAAVSVSAGACAAVGAASLSDGRMWRMTNAAAATAQHAAIRMSQTLIRAGFFGD